MVLKTAIPYPTEIVREGKAQIIIPKLNAFITKKSDYAPSKAPVFYNPIMDLNRDIAILAFKSYQKTIKREITFCEPLTSSGVRGIRVAVEVPCVKNIVIGDINYRAFQLAKLNVELNGLENQIEIENKDANLLLSRHGAPRRRFDIIDIDPFGSPIPYLDTALRAIRNNGLLALTATDLAPLCGVHSKACKRKYGGKPLRTEYCQETAIRLLIGCIAATAAKFDIGIRILFNHSTDHYIRSYIQIHYGAKKANVNLKNIGYILHCFACFHRESIKNPFKKQTRKCTECNSKMDWMGPLWLGELFNENFCNLMEKESKHVAFKNSRKIRKILTLVKGEIDGPVTYFVIDKISDKLSLPVPSLSKVIHKLQQRGYCAIPTHFNSRGIRTNASALTVQNIIKNSLKVKS